MHGWTGPPTRWSTPHRGGGGLALGGRRRAPARPWCRAGSCTRRGCRRTWRPEVPAAGDGHGGCGAERREPRHARARWIVRRAVPAAHQLLHLLLRRQHRSDARLEAHRRRRLVGHRSGQVGLHSDEAHGCIRPALRGQERSALLQRDAEAGRRRHEAGERESPPERHGGRRLSSDQIWRLARDEDEIRRRRFSRGTPLGVAKTNSSQAPIN